jgi:formylmethanofuran:tetrahydromethanopterin formyltransferase
MRIVDAERFCEIFTLMYHRCVVTQATRQSELKAAALQLQKLPLR